MPSPARDRTLRLLVGLLVGAALVFLIAADAAQAVSCSGTISSRVESVRGREITRSTLEFTCDVNLGGYNGRVFTAVFRGGGVAAIDDGSDDDYAPRQCENPEDGDTVECTGYLPAGARFVGRPRNADYVAQCKPVTITIYGADPNTPLLSFAPTPSCGEQAHEAALTVTRSGDGSGTVESYYFQCPDVCSHTYNVGTNVVLVATAASGSTFAGWSGGACKATGTCQFTITANTKIDARFTKQGETPLPPSKLHASVDSAIKVSGTSLSFMLGCHAPAGRSCAVLAVLTATQHMRSGKVIAVSSRTRSTTSKKVVTLAKKSLTIASGAHKTVTLTLNKTGKTLLARFKKLPARITVSLTNTTKPTVVVSKTVTFKQQKTKRGR